MTDSANALGDLLALPAEALVLSARRLRLLCDLFQTCGGFGGPTRPTLCRCIIGILEPFLPLLKPGLSLRGSLPGGSLIGGQCA